uniref:Brain-specific angiogenesis inhibitor 1-associated protein 2 n=2 Tax=Stomoxys calcitrans TaxID=35570 RepID=A0A1I8QDI8_STOCA
MESEEITKMVDGVYKNILEKFNPGARQLITAGKGYLKSLHGAATSARVFNEALAKIAMNAQHSGTGDIGAALLSVVSVYKEIQEQQMNILKAFYVDLLVPLETNLEKDTKVVQHEQKKFLQQHKVRMESFQKAVSTMKKQRKKKASPENTEKELRTLQLLEDQKKKLDAFCEQSYKNAMTQERRRYGFVLERQCSIAKHWMAYHSTGKQVIDNHLENWQEIATSRETLPTTVYDGNSLLVGNKRLERLKDSEDSHGNGGGSSSNLLKKSRSVDVPFGDIRNLHESHVPFTQNSLPRAKSDFNLNSSMNSSVTTAAITANDHTDSAHWDQRTVVKALYAYMPSGENQLPFDEGDRIALVGSKAKGWQFGENLRTQMFGWFPIAYTNAEMMLENKMKSDRDQHTSRNERFENMHYERHNGGGAAVNGNSNGQAMRNSYHDQYMESAHEMDSDATYRRERTEESSPTRMFGDTYRNQKKYRPSTSGNPRPGPPPTLPAPVPSVANGSRMLNSSQSFCAPNGSQMAIERRKQKLQNGNQINHQSSMNQMKPAAAAKTSLHSSNDSGFANEPPPQPEVDYSDDEQPTSRVPIRRRADTNSHMSNNREVASWTLNRNFRSSIDSQIDDRSLKTLNRTTSGKMRYDLIASDDEILQASSAGIKRTKSFWKFGGGRHEDILAGMSLWQHRDLVATPNMDELRDEGYRTTSSKMESEKEMERSCDTLTKSNSNHSTSSQEVKRVSNGGGGAGGGITRKDSITSMEMYDDDENIYGLTPMVREPMLNRSGANNFTPKSRMKIMKTIEIDIENPGENERLSTIKRNQKEYRESMSNRHSMPMESSNNSNNNNNNSSKKQSSMNNRNSSGGGNGNGKKSYEQKMAMNGQQQMQNKMSNANQNRNPPPQDMFPSTESEAGESELDNGTLKMSDVNNFFDNNMGNSVGGGGGGGGIIMKTVKRKDILKQYYTSEDDSDDPEIKSTSSDPYDCIVINDHLVRRDEKHRRAMHHALQQEHQMEFQTFRATTSSSNAAGGGANSSANKNNSSSNGGGASNKKKSERHQQEQQREAEARNRSSKSSYQDQQDNQMRYSDSTLTRHQTNSVLSTPTATILPRTRLVKSSNMSSMTLERNSTSSAQKSMHSSNERGGDKHYGKTYGPWYDFWDQPEQSVKSNKMK